MYVVERRSGGRESHAHDQGSHQSTPSHPLQTPLTSSINPCWIIVSLARGLGSSGTHYCPPRAICQMNIIAFGPRNPLFPVRWVFTGSDRIIRKTLKPSSSSRRLLIRFLERCCLGPWSGSRDLPRVILLSESPSSSLL
jgi:hypothetical protein